MSPRDFETEMLVYCELARLAEKKQQLLSRDRFLLLAGLAAIRAGLPEVAEFCRKRVLETSPHHLIAEFPTLTELARTAEGQALFQRLERYCPFERAEYLLSQQGLSSLSLKQSEETPQQAAFRILNTSSS